MSKKYVIEIKPEYEDSFKGVILFGAKESTIYVDTLSIENLEELNSDYINEHFDGLQEESYQKGYEDGKKNNDRAYQRGLEDAWTAARKIVGDTDQGGLKVDALAEIFGTSRYSHIMRDNTAQEAIDKIKAYEEKQKAENEIKVRDGVIVHGLRGVVTCVNGNLYTVMMYDGSCGRWCKRDLKKTGKHYDIDKILEEMKK